MQPSNLGNPKTASETLFEAYLTANGHTDWTHEQRIPGKPTTPDYQLLLRGTKSFFEVKEFAAVYLQDGQGGPCYPYGPLRQKINQAARQFKYYKEFPCSLVLADPNGALVGLTTPVVVCGAMFGDVGWDVPGNTPDAPVRQVFTRGGKMLNSKNTTINAIVCLTPYQVGQRQLEIALDRREKQLGRKTRLQEAWEFVHSTKTRKAEGLRVIVFENPFARIPQDRNLFRGCWDERWGKQGSSVRRIYVGRSLRRWLDIVKSG
jgi:hypothetical protein